MDRLDQIRLFLRVVEGGSFSKAGKAAGVTQSTVSKQIAGLERMLGAQLLRRTSRGLSATDAGREFYDVALGMLSALDEAQARISQDQRTPRGRLRVTVFPGWADRFLIPRLPDFLEANPELSIDLDVSDRLVSLSGDGFDVAIRAGELADANMVAHRIGALRAIAVASPSYLQRHGEPASPSDLGRHAGVGIIANGQAVTWLFDADRQAGQAPVSRIRTNDAAAARAGVTAGIGIGIGPDWLFEHDLATGDLVEILSGYPLPSYPVYAIRPAGHGPTRKVTVFLDFVRRLFSDDPRLAHAA